MKKKLLLIFTILLTNFIFATNGVNKEPVIIEITESTLPSVYYHQNSFAEPTKLVFTNLTSVKGYIYFHQNVNLVAVEFPKLVDVGDYFYFYGNASLETISAPNLVSVNKYIAVTGQTSLKELNICNLKQIKGSSAYYSITGNNTSIDNTPVCFNHGAPTNLQIDQTTIQENKEINTVIGTLSADSTLEGGLTYSVNNSNFIISGNKLLTNSTFDFETTAQYKIKITVRNPLGEKLQSEFIINVLNVSNENIKTIEIADETLDNVYYYQNSFTEPTKLVFTNLTSVKGYVFFSKNANLVGVEFPKLINTGDYFYFEGNKSLETISAPDLTSVNKYIYVTGQTLLTEINICNLKEIKGSSAYWYITGNNAIIDNIPICFNHAPPTNLQIDNTSVEENKNLNTLIGTLSADTALDTNSLTYTVNNSNFIIKGNQLFTNSPLDFESNNQYKIKIGVRNQLGEKLEREIIINVLDVLDENITVIEISDATMDNIMYHKDNSFVSPTKLVFKNLTSVKGYVYFYENINLVAVEFPKLINTEGYIFVNGNPSLQKINAPNLQTVSDYIYVAENKLLEELNICNLFQILNNSENKDSYYYIKNNPKLDFTTTCLTNTSLTFIPVDEIIIKPVPNTLIGTFSSDAGTGEQIRYFFIDENGNETTNSDFVIVGNNLYLTKDYSEYTTFNYNLNINALRAVTTKNSQSKKSKNTVVNSINEKIALNFSLNLENATLGLNDFSSKRQITVYPNPAKNYFNIDSEILFDTISIYDLTGRHIKTFKDAQQAYDINAISSGLYLLHLKQKNNAAIHIEKIIIE